jgi:plastocyanin
MLSFSARHKVIPFIVLAGALLFSVSACTMTVHALVQDENGKPVQNAVVFATAAQSGDLISLPVVNAKIFAKRDSIDLKRQMIIPLVLPVRIGTAVSFSNRDAIQHQVYSVSLAKQFKVTIDKGASSPDLVFDKPGVVVMGSAINDRMVGYIYVLETPWFARTGADGMADLRDLPAGHYDVRVWHPGMKRPPEATTTRVSSSSRGGANAKFSLTLHPLQKPEPKPNPADGVI